MMERWEYLIPIIMAVSIIVFKGKFVASETDPYAGKCYDIDITADTAGSVATYYPNETYSSVDDCISYCQMLALPIAAIESKMICYCFQDTAFADNLIIESSTVGCDFKCEDGNPCGGEFSTLSLYKTKINKKYIELIISEDLLRINVQESVTATVNASDPWYINWGDGSAVDELQEHMYTISGTFEIRAYLTAYPDILISKSIIVDEGPKLEITCPPLLEVSIPDSCNTSVYRQGYDFQLSYTTTNGSFTNTFNALVPPEIKMVIGTHTGATTGVATTEEAMKIIVLSNSLVKTGGYITKILVEAEVASGLLRLYIIIPACTTDEYCSLTDSCSSSCPAETDPLSCSPICSSCAPCSSAITGTAPTANFTYQLLSPIEITATSTVLELSEVIEVPAGARIGIGCVAPECVGIAPVKYRDNVATQESDFYFDTTTASSNLMSSGRSYLVQIVIREHHIAKFDVDLLCESAAPVPMGYVITPYTEETEKYVNEGSLVLSYLVKNSVGEVVESFDILCQQNISMPTFEEEIWMEFGKPKSFELFFSQGSPLFTKLDIDKVLHYDYKDDAIAGYTLTIELVYATEGLHLFTGNTSNQINSVLYNSTIHVVPPVTDNWILEVKCPCYNIEEGFNYTLTLAEQNNAPWNATIDVLFIAEDEEQVPQMNETVDFMTFDKEGAAAAIEKEYLAFVEKQGTYQVNVNMWNEVSSTKIETSILVEEGIRDVSATVLFDSSGEIFPPMGLDKNVLLANFTTLFYPASRTGIPLKWRIVINETDEVIETTSWAENITHIFKEDGDYTIIVGGYNTVQGWVESPPSTFKVVSKLSGFEITDDERLRKPGELKTVVGEFIVFTPLACILINFGDGKEYAYGNEKRCKSEVPKTEYKGEVQAPVEMTHSYSQEGIYDVRAIAADGQVKLSSELKVVIADIPCTMPTVKIVNAVKLPSLATKKWRSLSQLMEATADYQCNKSVPVNRWWTIAQIDPESEVTTRDELIMNILPSWNFSQLAIPSNHLIYGVYRIRYYLNIQASSVIDLERNDFTYIEITKTPLQAVMLAGAPSAVSRGFGQLLDLDPQELSSDPDYPEDKTLKINQLNFTWWCRQVAPNEEVLPKDSDNHLQIYNEQEVPEPLQAAGDSNGCFGVGPGTLRPSFRKSLFNTGSFILQTGTFELVLMVQKDDRHAYTSLMVTVSRDPPPSVLIKCAPSVCFPASSFQIVNPTNRVVLSGTCTADCGTITTYKWEIISTDGSPLKLENTCETLTPIPSSCKRVFWPRNTADAIINEDIFSLNPSVVDFKIRLSMTTSDKKTGFTEMLIRRNKQPEKGTCSLNPKYGYAMITFFEAKCGGWVDPEKLGIRECIFYIVDDDEIKTDLASTTKSPINLILPVGNFSCFVEIIDDLGSKTTVPLQESISVLPTKEMVDEFDYLEKINYYTNAGDQAALGMLLNALSSVRDNADWLSLDESLLENMTSSALKNRLTEVSDMNSDQLKVVHDTMNFETLSQINVGANVVSEAVGGLFKSNMSSLTVDMATREMAVTVLERIADKLPDVYVASPKDLEPVLSATLNAAHALMEGVNQVLIFGDEKEMINPRDEEQAVFLDYDSGDIDLNTVVPNDQSKRHILNVLDTTRSRAREQIARINAILNKITNEVLSKMTTGERVEAVSAYGAQSLLQKTTEVVLKKGMTLSLSNSGISIILPKNFCPSKYVYEVTDCKKEFSLSILGWPTVNYMYPVTSSLLANDTYVVVLEISIEKKMVFVANESHGIKVNIPRKNTLQMDWDLVDVTQNMSHYQYMVYHTFSISLENSGYTIEISPYNDPLPTNLVILIDHERIPTPTRCMQIKLLKTLTKNENETYSYFVNSIENNNKTGRFYVAVALIKNIQNLGKDSSGQCSDFNLKKDDFDKNFDSMYKFTAFSSGCYYFDEGDQEWRGSGMQLVEVSNSTTSCQTIHTTNFGSGYLNLKPKLDFEYIFANVGFQDNLSIYVTLIVLLTLYIIMMVWGHWMDRKDIKLRGVIALPDNKPEDKYLYEITFHTGPDKEATTESNINFILSGDFEESEVRYLPPSKPHLYRRFAINSFVMATPRPLGSLAYLRVFHDNTGEPPLDNWQLEMVVVRDLQTAEKFVFQTNSWLSFDRDEGTVDKIFTYSKNEEKHFSETIYIRSNRTANQDQMWMSIFLRPIGSRFDRKERVTVCFVFLFLSMFISAVWNDILPETPRSGFIDIGPFTLSVELLLTGLCILVLAFPVIYLISLVFKRARPRRLKTCRAINSIETQRKYQLQEQGLEGEQLLNQSKLEVQNTKTKRPKDKSPIKCIPWWTRIIAWIVCILIIASSLFFVWSYGILWGEIKTTKWLSSFLLCFMLSILISQWIKVLVVSLIASTVLKHDLSADDIDCDEELPHLKPDETWSNKKSLDPNIRRKVYKIEGVNSDNPEIEKVRILLRTNREMRIVLKDIMVYCVFLIIIFIITSERTDRNGLLLQKHLKNTFIKIDHQEFDFSSKVKTTDDWWYWVKNVVLQELRAQRDYNGDPPYGLRGFLDDRANRIMGYAVLRQIRNKRFNCEVPSPLDTVIDWCSGTRGIENEDTQDFCAGWSYNETFYRSCKWNEFKYKSDTELEAYSSLGRLSWYSGGGYVFRLSGSQVELTKRMDDLQRNNWIDKNTRAVILEFSTYNANVNLFSICTVSAEFNEGGGILPKWRFDPLKLIKKAGPELYLYYSCEMLFLIALIFFTLKELWSIKKQKIAYFSSYWNIAEICIIIVSYMTVGLYFYRYVLTQSVLKIFGDTSGNGYIRMDSAAMIDQYYIYGMGLIGFFSILKLIKLLQFNKRMDALALTIKACWVDLKMFLFAFAIIFFAFSCLFLFMFSSSIEHFARLISAIQATFKMMMGKFDSKEMTEVNSFSPILFFAFSLINNMIMINIILTVILVAFNQVKMDLEKMENRLNVIDFVWNSCKQVLRLEKLPRIHVEPKLTDRVEEKPGMNHETANANSLPDKVSQLLQYINNIYFDGRLDLNDTDIRKSIMQNQVSDSFASLKDGGNYNEKKILGNND